MGKSNIPPTYGRAKFSHYLRVFLQTPTGGDAHPGPVRAARESVRRAHRHSRGQLPQMELHRPVKGVLLQVGPSVFVHNKWLYHLIGLLNTKTCAKRVQKYSTLRENRHLMYFKIWKESHRGIVKVMKGELYKAFPDVGQGDL